MSYSTKSAPKKKELRAMAPEEAFQLGVDDYWGGECPKGWNTPAAWLNPYLAGWRFAADAENSDGFYAGGS